jgi:hypothetical protein
MLIAYLVILGRSACSYSYGARIPLALPADIRTALGQHPNKTQEVSASVHTMEVDGGEPASSVSQKNLKSLDWFIPTETNYIRNEVSNILSTIVYK